MKISHFIILAASAVGASSAYAASSMLPTATNAPVLDNSTAYRTAMLKPVGTESTYQLTARLEQLRVAVAGIEAKVNQQAVAIGSLQQGQNVINAKLNVVKVPVAMTKSPFDNSGVISYPPLTGTIPVTEKQRYENAYTILKAKKVDLAIAEFQKIIRDFPAGKYAPNAQYWLGEAYVIKGNKEAAMQAFDKVVQGYPKSNKVPDSLLKLGFVQLSLKNRIKAKEYLDYVIVAYPGTNAAALAMQKKAKAAL